MMIRTHVPLGVATALCVGGALDMKVGVPFIAAAAIGSMLPDIDHPQGKLNQKILLVNNKMGKLLTYTFLAYLMVDLYIKNSSMNFLLYLVPAFLMIAFSKHRGITHSILGSVGMIFIVYKLEPMLRITGITMGFAMGYISHIVSDCFTHSGVELLFPNRKNFNFPLTIRTNGIAENIIFLGTTMFLVYMCFRNYNIFS